jgi:uncharacterized repeat protein (TIGR01451 family)
MKSRRSTAYVRAVRSARRRARPFRRARALVLLLGALVIGGSVSLFWPDAEAAGPGTGIIAYSDGSSNDPFIREWDGAAWSAATGSIDAHEWRIAQGAASSQRNEKIFVGVNIHKDITAMRWNGSTWSLLPFSPLGKVTEDFWWSMDVAYETASGDAMLVWHNNTTGTAGISYRTWNGSTWSAEQTITTPVAGAPKQMHLAAAPSGDEMVLVVSNASSQDYALVWNGSSWGNAITLSAAGSGDDLTDVYVEYERQSGDALVVYGRGSTSLLYRTWNGAWSAEGSITAPAPAVGNVRWATLGAEAGSDRIAIGVTTFSANTWLAVWDGSGVVNKQVATQTASGTTFPGVAVAFESQSGKALALYGEGASVTRYRTWTSGGGWSAQANGPDVGQVPNSLMLYPSPFGNEVVAIVQDAGSDLSGMTWSGSAWGTATELEDDTKELKNQPWDFVWDPYSVPAPPVFDQDLGDRLDDEGATVAFDADATDPNLDPLTWSATGLPPGVTIDPATGTVSGTIDYTASVGSPYSVTITVTDPGGLTDVDTFTWTVNEVNRAPTVDQADQSSAEGDVIALSMVASDPDGDDIDFVATGLPPGLAIDAETGDITGTIDYSASPGSPYTVTVTGTDDGSPPLDDQVVFSWTVANTNRPPVFDGDLADQVDFEGETVSLPAPATDPDGEAPTYSATGLPPGISIDPATGLVSGTISPGAAAGSPYAVELRATDGGGLFDADVFTWIVSTSGMTITTGIEDTEVHEAAPGTFKGNNTSISVDEDQSGGISQGLVQFLGFIGTGPGQIPPGSTINSASLELTVVDRSDDAVIDLYRMLAAWSEASTWNSLTGGVQTDDAEAASTSDRTFTQTGSLGRVAITGLEDAVQSWVDGGAVHGWVLIASGTDDDNDGWDFASSEAADPADRPALILDFTPNAAPTFGQDLGDRTDAEGDAVSFSAAATDAEGHDITYSATGLPSAVSIDPGTGLISGTLGYTAAAGSPYNVTITATDQHGAANVDLFTWTVTNTNRLPTFDAALGDQSDAEGDAVSLSTPATDPDGETLVWSATGLPPGIYIDSATGDITGTVTYSASPGSPYAVTVRVEDGLGGFDEQTLTWTIADTPTPLLVTKTSDVTAPVNPGGSIQYTITISNAGSNPQTGITVTDPTPAGTSHTAGSVVIAGPAAATDIFATTSYNGSDGLLPWLTAWVEAGDDASPSTGTIRVAASASCSLGSCLRIGGNGVTIAGDTMVRSVNLSGNTTATLTFDSRRRLFGSAGGSVVLEARGPGASWVTLDSWALNGTDGAPVAESYDISAFIDTDTEIRFRGIGSGVQGALYIDNVRITVPGTASVGGSAPSTIASGLYLDAGESLTVRFRVTVNNPTALTQISNTVTVTSDQEPAGSQAGRVDPVNRPPVFNQNLPNRTDPEAAVVSIPSPATDPNAQTVTYSATGLPTGLSIDPSTGLVSGTISYTAASGSPWSVAITASDPGGLTATDTFSWTVTNTNRAPTLVTPTNRTDAEGAAVSLPVSGNDPDGDSLIWTATGLPIGLSMGPSTGTITGTVDYSAAAASPYTVTIRATDDGVPELFTEKSFTWAITDVNRPPALSAPLDPATTEGDPVTLAVVGGDPDGDDLAWTATGLPPGLTIDSATGIISGTPGFTASAGSPYSVTVRATDDGTPILFTQVSFTWTVYEFDRAPSVTAVPDQLSSEGDAESLAMAGSDPDGEALTWSASGLPPGLSIDSGTGEISGAVGFSAAGSHQVLVTATDAGPTTRSASTTFTWQVLDTNRAPTVQSPGDRSDFPGSEIALQLTASDPDGDELAFVADGLPSGLVVDADTGMITGTIAANAAEVNRVTLTVTDDGSPELAASVGFTWVVSEVVPVPPPPAPPENQPPIPVDDTVTLTRAEVPGGGIVVDAIGNDSDPEGGPLALVGAGPADTGEVAIVDGVVVFRPDTGWSGRVTFPYLVADDRGAEAQGFVTVVIRRPVGTGGLEVEPVPTSPEFGDVRLSPSTGAEMVLGTVFQSLYVLRVPLALLGGAVAWSLLLGGVLNLGFVVRSGLPRVVRRRAHKLAIVLAEHGARVDALSSPEAGSVVHRFLATDRNLMATGRRAGRDGDEWVEVETPNGRGWVPAFHLTEEVDRAGFADDPRPRKLVEEFVVRLRTRRDFADLVSVHGLLVAHHGPVEQYSVDRISGLLDDRAVTVWKGRNPAYPDVKGTFDAVIATSLLDAYDHPAAVLNCDEPVVPATVIPVEFTNFHFISIGAELHGPERLDQSAWLVMVTYEEGIPRIVGLVKEG